MNDLIRENPLVFDLPLLDLTRFSEPQFAKVAGEKFLVFLLGEDFYAISTTKVVEVSPSLPVSILPNAPEWLLGIANLRGEVISVLNLPNLLQKSITTLAPKSKFIILRSPVFESNVAFTADRISEIVSLPDKEIQSVKDKTSAHVFAKAAYKSHVVNLIDSEKLLASLKL